MFPGHWIGCREWPFLLTGLDAFGPANQSAEPGPWRCSRTCSVMFSSAASFIARPVILCLTLFNNWESLLPQISTCHQLLHPQVLQLLIKLFETEHSQLDVMEQVRTLRVHRVPLRRDSSCSSKGSACIADWCTNNLQNREQTLQI